MKGKSYSIPFGMVFKKYHCHKCGSILKKERNHRVVNKNDKDYFQYQRHNMYPRIEHDVYDHRFFCPKCNRAISFKEQCIIERIQKKNKTYLLEESIIKDNYIKAKEGCLWIQEKP